MSSNSSSVNEFSFFSGNIIRLLILDSDEQGLFILFSFFVLVLKSFKNELKFEEIVLVTVLNESMKLEESFDVFGF